MVIRCVLAKLSYDCIINKNPQKLKDPVVKSCVQVLDILLKAEQALKRRLLVGFTTLVPVLNYVANIPFHPVQNQTLKLILNCISDFPGMVSSSRITAPVPVLAKMLKKHL